MRNSAFNTVTTNSRGVKSSLTRMTLCRRGRSVLVLTFVFGVVTVSIIPAASPKQQDGLRRGSAGAAVRQALRHGLIAAADGRLDQFTGSGPVLKRGVLRQFQLDQRLPKSWQLLA